MIFDIQGAEEKIGYSFKDKMLLRKCFTHSSYSNENKNAENNEVLEFFGDAILDFAVTEYLCANCEGDEGVLTKSGRISCPKNRCRRPFSPWISRNTCCSARAWPEIRTFTKRCIPACSKPSSRASI